MTIRENSMLIELKRGEALFHRRQISEVGLSYKMERNGIRFILPALDGDEEIFEQRSAACARVRQFAVIVDENRHRGLVAEAQANLKRFRT